MRVSGWQGGGYFSFHAGVLVPPPRRHPARRHAKKRKSLVNILGLNAFHGDSSAALLVDGQLVVALEEERLNRIKHWAGFPALAARACLNGIDPAGVEHIAISRDPRAHFWTKA